MFVEQHPSLLDPPLIYKQIRNMTSHVWVKLILTTASPKSRRSKVNSSHSTRKKKMKLNFLESSVGAEQGGSFYHTHIYKPFYVLYYVYLEAILLLTHKKSKMFIKKIW
jgi:hypothetical protein